MILCGENVEHGILKTYCCETHTHTHKYKLTMPYARLTHKCGGRFHAGRMTFISCSFIVPIYENRSLVKRKQTVNNNPCFRPPTVQRN